MQVVDAAVFQIIQFLLYALQRFRKRIHVQEHPRDVPALVPFRIRFSFPIQFTQRLAAFLIGAPQHGEQVRKGLLITVIQFRIELFQFVDPAG